MLTTTSRRRILGSFRQCRTALLRFRHNGIRSAHSADRPQGHGLERIPHNIAAYCGITDNG
jgi:hypothetical protein